MSPHRSYSQFEEQRPNASCSLDVSNDDDESSDDDEAGDGFIAAGELEGRFFTFDTNQRERFTFDAFDEEDTLPEDSGDQIVVRRLW